MIDAGPDRIAQVLVNLLTHAVRYSGLPHEWPLHPGLRLVVADDHRDAGETS